MFMKPLLQNLFPLSNLYKYSKMFIIGINNFPRLGQLTNVSIEASTTHRNIFKQRGKNLFNKHELKIQKEKSTEVTHNFI